MGSDRQNVEFFHLSLVRLLCAGPDKDAFTIKGGCNLRFFFGSVRYSEDLDLDVSERVPVHALKDRMSRILMPDHVEAYGSRAAWDALQERVLEQLETARAASGNEP